MRKLTRRIFPQLFAVAIVLSGGICGIDAFAQDEKQELRRITGMAQDSGGGMGIIEGVPFSGVLVCENIQTLPASNRIVKGKPTHFYRDSAGRMRIDGGENIDTKYITINDHFGGKSFTLDLQNRTAKKYIRPIPKRTIMGAKLVSVVNIDVATDLAMVTTGGSCGPVKIDQLNRSLPIVEKKESLGSRVIEGVEAEGTRITYTIPAGSINNESPIEVIAERWYSWELALDVLVKLSDPRSGESTWQMTKIDRSQPDALLFELPPGYAVEEINQKGKPDTATAASSDRARRMIEVPGDRVQPMTASLKPTVLYKEKPPYTKEARDNRVEGTVVLNLVFTAEGKITNIRVVRGLPHGLTENAIRAAEKILFNPALKNGAPVSVRGNLEFKFMLESK
jgi:TonB family protein